MSTCDTLQSVTRSAEIASGSQLPQRGDPGYDKLGKVRPVLEALQSRFVSSYDPHCEQSIDEAMINRLTAVDVF